MSWKRKRITAFQVLEEPSLAAHFMNIRWALIDFVTVAVQVLRERSLLRIGG
jgi:hypothetical protein